MNKSPAPSVVELPPAPMGASRSVEERNQLVLQNRGLVGWVQDGVVSLIYAAGSYDDSLGVKFGTYAARVIWKALLRRAYQGRLIQIPEKVASAMLQRPVPEDYQERVAFAREASSVVSFSELMVGEENDFQAISEPACVDPEIVEPTPAVERALACLPARERDVVRLRFWDEKTLEECGGKLGITKERVRQIQDKALRRLHCLLRPWARGAMA